MTSEMMMLGILAILAVLLGFGIRSRIREGKMRDDLRQRGLTTVAQITNLASETRSSTDSNDNTTYTDYYYVEYRYAVNGTSYSRRDSISFNDYNSLQEGQKIEVLYLPENPGNARRASTL